jgi:hypothetical protein
MLSKLECLVADRIWTTTRELIHEIGEEPNIRDTQPRPAFSNGRARPCQVLNIEGSGFTSRSI